MQDFGSANDDLLIQRLLEILNEGKRVSTYKLALLIALINWVVINPGKTQIPTRDLAELVLEIYFRQIGPFIDQSGTKIELRQSNSKNATILEATKKLKFLNPGVKQLHQLQLTANNQYEECVSQVEKSIVSDPIPRLQRVGDKSIIFLYECTWKENQSIGVLRKNATDFIELESGVSQRLVVLGPLVRPFIEQVWLSNVITYSGINTEEDGLKQHLFGSQRSSFSPKIRKILHDLQGGVCFYCVEPLVGVSPIDHFIPWSRFPNDDIENLVLACKKCNGSKSDYLASKEFYSKWLWRIENLNLAEIALGISCGSNKERARSITKSIYQSVAKGSIIWHGKQLLLPVSDLELNYFHHQN